MKYVLDASVAVRWVLPYPLKLKALQLRDDYRRQVHELIAPSHFPGEIGPEKVRKRGQGPEKGTGYICSRLPQGRLTGRPEQSGKEDADSLSGSCRNRLFGCELSSRH
jgi:hypothetical protein